MSMKRKLCDMSAVFSDDSDDSCAVTGSGGRGDRKRKRGEIEKRRRDRINDCLNEIKELVPNALEKSNVNKLEKAEILQMAVEHLRMVAHNNPDRMAGRGLAEVQSAGFRECMGEVSRYLVAVEGMHVEEPLRLRLMSPDLMYFSTIAKSCSQLLIIMSILVFSSCPMLWSQVAIRKATVSESITYFSFQALISAKNTAFSLSDRLSIS